MTVSTERSQIIAIADGVQTIYPYDFRVLVEADLFVEVGVDDIDPADYTVQGIGDPFGGTITFLVAPADTLPVTITRTMPVTQAIDYRPFDPFPAETHEVGLDRLTMICQQLQFDIEQGLANVNYRGAWVTTTLYEINDIIQFPDLDGAYYLCRIEHIAGVFQDDLDAGFWELFLDLALILESTQICIDSAAAALVSETNSLASEVAAAASEAAALASELAAGISATAADVSRQGAEAAASEAAGRQDDAFRHASELEDVPVDDGVNPPGFSAFHWAKKSEGIVTGGGVVPIGIEVIDSTGIFTDDLDTTDFTGHPFSDPALATRLLVEPNNTFDAGYSGEIFRYFGGKPRTFGVGAPASFPTDFFLVATSLASSISYVPEPGQAPVSNNVQAALTELGALLPLAVPIGIILPSYLSTAPIGFAFELGETLGNAGSGADFAGDKYEEAFDIFNQVLPNNGSGIFANGDTVVLPTAPADRRVLVSKGSGNDLGETGGSPDHTLTIGQLPQHNHGGVTDDPGSHTHQVQSRFNPPDGNVSGTGRAMESNVGSTGQFNTQGQGQHTHSIPNQGGGGAHPIEQPFIVTNNIIKISHT